MRLVQLRRRDDRHELSDLTVGIRFQGDYDECYTQGDNAGVLATDTKKNTDYAGHFVEHNSRIEQVRVDLAERRWHRIHAGGRADPHAFVGQGPDTRTARVVAGRDGVDVSAGIADLLILKSSRSAFANFLRDELTTLPETQDRILATSLTASWRYRSGHIEYGPVWSIVRETLLESFAGHDSASVQHTLYAMGQAVLARAADVTEIHLVMPNKHHLPVDLSAFGLENRNEIFVATEEPFGLIEATIAR